MLLWFLTLLLLFCPHLFPCVLVPRPAWQHKGNRMAVSFHVTVEQHGATTSPQVFCRPWGEGLQTLVEAVG